ncbi:MAG: putative Ig domain-containing protein, partial [Bryobacterales bacterium]|nr:putative Ig domain-containing protein [Bryobacterales bacterium]
MNRLVLLSCFAYLTVSLSAQSLVMISGNGQLVGSPVPSSVPLVVEAIDASGNPITGVPVQWAATNSLILTGTISSTDAHGQASTGFTGFVPQPNQSFQSSTVTASSSYGTVSFSVTSVPIEDNQDNPAPLPTVQLITPTLGTTLSAPSGATLPGALVVKVAAAFGAQAGYPMANVSLLIVNANDPTQTSPAHCNGPDGAVLTDSSGTATCDLVVTGAPGTTVSIAGEVGYLHYTPQIGLMITTAASCTFSLSANSEAISSAGGSGSVTVATGPACGWTAASNANFITISSGASGTGNGTVSYNIAADSGSPRTGTLTIAGTTFTVNQGAGSAGALVITSPANLPGGATNQSYAATLSASGGIPPYTWSITQGALPAGITLNASTGLLSGASTAAGANDFTATVEDSAGAQASQLFSLTISTSSSTFLITNSSFPNGVLGQTYTQALTAVGGQITPFVPYPSFFVSGGTLPPGLIVKNTGSSSSLTGTPTTTGVYAFALTATDAANHSTSANFTITITGTPTSEQMTVSPPTLAFTVQLGSVSVPAVQNVSITGNSGQLNYTTMITTGSGGGWLVAQNPTSGNTPGTLQVGVANYSSLAAGTYTGTIAVSSQAANSPQAVQVILTLLAAPTLTITPQQFTVTEGQSTASNPMSQTIQVSAPTASVSFSAVASTDNGGNWLTINPQTATTPGTLTVSIDDAGLGIGTFSGVITITPSSGTPQTVRITLVVISPETLSAAPAPVAFSYAQGSPSPAAQNVTVSNSGTAVLTISAVASTNANGSWLAIAPASGSTPMSISISVNPSGLPLGTYKGTITVTASDDSVTPLAIPVTLTVTPPIPVIGSVTNGASFATGPVAPGEIITIFGSGLGPATGVSAASGIIGSSLSDTQVMFDSFAAPVLYSSVSQVSVIAPFELTGASSTNLTVVYQGVSSTPTNLQVADSMPGIFTLNAAGQGAVINQDGTINSSSNGAAPGSVISIYATGAGETSPAGVDGIMSPGALPLPVPLLPVSVEIGGLPAVVSYAGAAPLEVAGLLQVNATVPAGVPTGTSVPVV